MPGELTFFGNFAVSVELKEQKGVLLKEIKEKAASHLHVEGNTAGSVERGEAREAAGGDSTIGVRGEWSKRGSQHGSKST
jgi:hypothetical protein